LQAKRNLHSRQRIGSVLNLSKMGRCGKCANDRCFHSKLSHDKGSPHRYLVGLSEPATGALALGKAFHGTLARNFRQKMSTGRDMETGELAEALNTEWSLALSEAELRDDEDAAELATTAQAIVATYMAEAAPSVKPRAVEQAVQGEIARLLAISKPAR
jgi:hypothetical protein